MDKEDYEIAIGKLRIIRLYLVPKYHALLDDLVEYLETGYLEDRDS